MHDVETVPLPGAWVKRGRCHGRPDLTPYFFPERGDDVAFVKSICGPCAVRGECLAYAVAHPSLTGIWGGTSHRERDRMRGTRL